MDRAEVIRKLRAWPTGEGQASIGGLMAEAAEMLEADSGRTHYDAAAAERARIREALIATRLTHFHIEGTAEIGVVKSDVDVMIERICGPQEPAVEVQEFRPATEAEADASIERGLSQRGPELRHFSRSG